MTAPIRSTRTPHEIHAVPAGLRWTDLTRWARVVAAGTLVALLMVNALVLSTDAGRWRIALPDLSRIEADGAVRGADAIDAITVQNRANGLTEEVVAAAIDRGLSSARMRPYPRYTEEEWSSFQRGFRRGAEGRYQFLRRTGR